MAFCGVNFGSLWSKLWNELWSEFWRLMEDHVEVNRAKNVCSLSISVHSLLPVRGNGTRWGVIAL